MKTNGKENNSVKRKIEDFKKTLNKKIDKCNQVFIITHKKPDFDAIASIGAMALICKKLKKASYIIIDDDYEDLPYKIISMIDKIKDKFIVISLEDYESTRTDNDLLITVDVNKNYMTYLDKKYNYFNDIVIIDHHNEDKSTINSRNKLVLENVSSTSEIFYFLLNNYKIKASDLSYYTYLLAGIYLDTNKCQKNIFASTHEAIKGLIEEGADQQKVDELFSLDYESDLRVHRLISKATFINLRIPVTVSGDEIYTKEEIAQAADHMLKYDCDASIAVGKSKDGSYNVSARTKNGEIGIDNIMFLLNNGGGNLSSASCPAIYCDDASKLEDKIIKIIKHKHKKD